jgi:hypothetical protein
MAPDWLMKLTGPGGGMMGANVAFIRMPSSVFTTPRQFGPIMRMPYLCAIASSCCSRSAPAGPTSLKPAVITTSERTPRSPHCSAAASASSFGTVMIARSTTAGTSWMLGYAGIECTAVAFGFTG